MWRIRHETAGATVAVWILLAEDDGGIALQVRLTVGQVSQTSVAMRPVVGPSRR
jgi:hypothetical protein